jgi:hypothetical protein
MVAIPIAHLRIVSVREQLQQLLYGLTLALAFHSLLLSVQLQGEKGRVPAQLNLLIQEVA